MNKNRILYRAIISIAFISVATSAIVIPIDIINNKNNTKGLTILPNNDEQFKSSELNAEDLSIPNPFIKNEEKDNKKEEIKEKDNNLNDTNDIQIISSPEVVKKSQEEELWEEFEQQVNNPISNNKYSKSQIELIKKINNINLREDFYNSPMFIDNPNLKEVWRQYFIDSALIILDDISKINKLDLDNLEYGRVSKNFWYEIIKDYHEIRELLFIELSKAYNNSKNSGKINNAQLRKHVSFLCLKITNIEAMNLIWVSEEIEKQIKLLINSSLTEDNKTYQLIWPLISKLFILVSEQTFFQQSNKDKLGTEELSKVLFSNLVSSAGPLIVDFLLNNLKDILPTSGGIDPNDEGNTPNDSNKNDLKTYTNFVYKLLNGKANYKDIEHIIPKDTIKAIPQSFYGIAFNTINLLIGNPFNNSGVSIKDFNLSLFKRIFSVFDLVNAVVDLNSLIADSKSINTSYFFNWISDQEQVIKNKEKREEKLSEHILPILDLFDRFLSGRLELSNYDKNSQRKSLNILLESTFKVLSQLNVVEYNVDNSKEESLPGIDETWYHINNIKDKEVKNVLSDTFIFIQSLSPVIYKFESFDELKNNDKFSYDTNIPINDTCKIKTNFDYSSCLLRIYSSLKILGVHNDQIADRNIKFAKSYLKSFAMNKINSLDSSYSLVYKDIKDDSGNDISFVQNYVDLKQKLITSIFITLYGNNSKYLDSYITMNEGLYLLPGTEYKSLSPILSSTLMSFDNYFTSQDFNINDLVNDYTPIVNIFVDMINNIILDDPVAGTIISSLFDMVIGKIRPSELLKNISKVVKGIPWIPSFIIDLLAKDFENWIKSKHTYTDKFKGIFTQLAKLLTIKDKIFCSGIPVGSGYWHKAENAFSSSGIYKYFNISATYNRQETGCWFFHRPSDIYSSSKYDPFTMIDNYVVNKLVSTTNITEDQAPKVLEDILYQLIGKGLNKQIPGYIRPYI